MEAYKHWVRQNRQWLVSIESIANTLTWFFPERFANSEIAAEAFSALVGLLTATNQHIIDSTPNPHAQTSILPGRQVVSASTSPHRCFPWSLCLSALKELEVLVEVVAEHYQGQDRKWTVLTTVEAIKALLRVIIFYESGYKMLLDGGETAYVAECGDSSCSESNSLSFSTGPSRRSEGYISSTYQESGRESFQDVAMSSSQDMEARAIKALSKFGESIQSKGRPSWIDSQRTLSKDSIDRDQNACTFKPSLLTIWKQNGAAGECFVLGELLLVLRPVIYVLLIRQYGLRSWKPWVTSLFIDVTGMGILLGSNFLVKRKSGSAVRSYQQKNIYSHFSVTERQELKRRQILWALYLMRDPFFGKCARQPLENMERLMRSIPMFGILVGKAVELLVGVQTRYSYTSAS